MRFIAYNSKQDTYYATKKRPSNQSAPKTIDKIAERLAKSILDNEKICLTELQERYIKKVKANNLSLSGEGIDIAHHIAISQIIRVLAIFMNDPCSVRFKYLTAFTDAMCSTESPEDDKGRSVLETFFKDVIDENYGPEELCERADQVIILLNGCTRNLIPGYSSVNRSIGQNKDPHLVKTKKTGLFQETETSIRISNTFEKMPGAQAYEPKTMQSQKRQEFFLSSSVSAKVKDSWAEKESVASGQIKQGYPR